MCNFTRAATVMKKNQENHLCLVYLGYFILTLVSNVCEEALMSLFWAPKDSTNYRKSGSIFLGTVVIKKMENEMVEGQGRERKTCLFPRPSSTFPESTSHQLSHGCISYFTYHKRTNTPKKLVPMQAIVLPGPVYRWLLI